MEKNRKGEPGKTGWPKDVDVDEICRQAGLTPKEIHKTGSVIMPVHRKK